MSVFEGISAKGFFHTKSSMLTVLLRSIIIFTVLVIGIRFMGKRTLGELQPYEFVIMLAVAELACIPMQDISISIFYGLVPMGVIIVLHFAITVLTAKSIKARRLLNGRPFIVIDDNGICARTLKKLNIDVNDLLASIRQQGCFSITQIKYGIIETNGAISLLKNEEAPAPNSIPVTLIVEGRYMSENMQIMGITQAQVEKVMSDNRLKLKDVLLMTADSGKVFIQPKDAKYIEVQVE